MILRKNSVCRKILYYLYDNPNEKVYPAKIQKNYKERLPSLSKGVSSLENMGLVNSDKIGRIRYLKITKKGKLIVELVKKVEKMLNGKERNNVGRFIIKMGKKDEIIKEVKQIEEKENVKVLFLIESGSRAWGWESEDSDYDVRGVYVQNHNVFKELKSQISCKIGDLDIELWDLKKFLTLMGKSNPSVWEWLSSNIIYLDKPIREELKNEFIRGYSKFALKKHYLSMARQNFSKYINQIGDTANLKKYVYVLRSIACINYIEKTGLPPPKNYKKVINCLPREFFNFFEKIVEDKKKSESLEGKRNYEAEKYIVSFFDKQFERDISKFKDLNIIYQGEIK